MAEIEIRNLSKSYGQTVALQDISLSIMKSELFGLVGPDGAGKSTLFDILVTILLPDKGTASVEGSDVVEDYRVIRSRIGYMPGRFSLYPDLTVYENLDFFASVFGGTIEENFDLIRDIWVQIEPFKTRPAGKLSGGMKQKLALCCALVHKPSVLFLDEPTTGVDPVSRKEFWDMLKSLKQRGITILVSTPYMDEAVLCERIALIQSGRIMAVDTPQGIIGEFAKPLYSIKAANLYALLKDLRLFHRTHSCHIFGQVVHLAVTDASVGEPEVRRYLTEKGHAPLRIERIRAGIEDCFMELMKSAA